MLVLLLLFYFIIFSSENFQLMLSLTSFNILFLPKKLMYKKKSNRWTTVILNSVCSVRLR